MPSTDGMATGQVVAGAQGSEDALIGQSVGNYRVLARIGRGGMGAVYLAHHAVLGRNAAIKVLLPEFSNNVELVGRFFNEARATAQLRHGGFVQIFDSGNLPDGSSYLVMEHLRGVNLGAAIEWRASLTPGETLPILRDVATSVAFAHKYGIVHRDLKPDNIFLAVGRDESSGRDRVTIKVLDFGIAKLSGMAGVDGRQSARTRTGSMMGTPLFMSPEQCRGAGQVDHRSDIYSLGCIAYNALAGQPPFPYEGFGEIIAAHLGTPPPPVRVAAPHVPVAVEAFVMSLLAKDPAERPQSMDAVLAVLGQLQDALPAHESGRETDLLSLVPPQALVPEAPPPPSVSSPRSATTPMSGPRSGSDPNPGPAAPNAGPAAPIGRTRHLPSGSSHAAGATSTLGGYASEIGETAGGRLAARSPGRRLAIGALALLGVAGAAGLLLFLVGGPRKQGHDSHPLRTGDSPVSGRAASSEAPTEAPRARPTERAADPKAKANANATVVLRIASVPPGAAVVEGSTGKTLGATPFEAAFPRADLEARLTLRKHGYRSRELTLKLDKDAGLSVTLEKRTSTAPDRADDDRRKL
jgi:serine/threonine protein kinase